MYNIKQIQQALDNGKKHISQWTPHHMANRIQAETRKGDDSYKESCRKAQIKNKGATGAKICVTPFGEYRTKVEFRKALGFHRDGRMKQMPHLYYFKENGPGEPTYQWIYYTPVGHHAKREGLWELYYKLRDNNMIQHLYEKDKGIAKDIIYIMKHLMRKDPKNFYRKWEVQREWATIDVPKS